MTTIYLETKQHTALESTLPFDIAETTQQEFGKEAYHFLLNALQDLPVGSVLTLSLKEERADKETKIIVNNQSDTEGGTQAAYLQGDEPFMTTVYDYIAQNIENEDLSIDDLTQVCAMSRSQLFRKIKALTAKTPAQLIRDYRLDTARRLLQTDKTKRVSEVMYAVGFNDAKHFGQIFKQRFGMSPQAMKR
jgi:AraC-like DNA-binding protein